jgi:hypothetical protein
VFITCLLAAAWNSSFYTVITWNTRERSFVYTIYSDSGDDLHHGHWEIYQTPYISMLLFSTDDWPGGWVGRRDVLELAEMGNISASAGGRTPAVQTLASHTIDRGVPAHSSSNNNNNNNNSGATKTAVLRPAHILKRILLSWLIANAISISCYVMRHRDRVWRWLRERQGMKIIINLLNLLCPILLL